MEIQQQRKNLLEIYSAALHVVDGKRCVAAALAAMPVSDSTIDVVAIGKAAVAMMSAACGALGERLGRGLLITKQGYAGDAHFDARIDVIETGHPWPTEASLQAGKKLLQFIDAAPQHGQLLFLISGGSSSLVEVLPESVTLGDLRRLNDWLLGSGFDIHAMNHVRKAVSCIKGGRLAQQLNGHPARVLLISDVPGDDPATIGSGLLVPDTFVETEAPFDVPDWVEQLMRQGPPAPRHGDACFDHVEIEIVATLDDAKRAAAEKARALGYEVYEHAETITGDVELVARQLVVQLLDGPEVLHVWGGETTVRLPATPGRGGRNQQLSLIAATQLAGVENIAFLAAATDGSDGPTDDAGGLVDAETIERGELEGLDAETCLAGADAGHFLEASGDLIQTGPTGTNVMDLMLGLKWL